MPMSSGMGMQSSGFGARVGRLGGGSLSSSALGGGMNQAMDAGRDGVMPPNFGYPFYQPPRLGGVLSALPGMPSM
jgi:hypothetical protein